MFILVFITILVLNLSFVNNHWYKHFYVFVYPHLIMQAGECYIQTILLQEYLTNFKVFTGYIVRKDPKIDAKIALNMVTRIKIIKGFVAHLRFWADKLPFFLCRK